MFRRKEDDETSIWISNTDLISGLLVIFLFISVVMTERALVFEAKYKNQSQSITRNENMLRDAIDEEFDNEELERFHVNEDGVGHAYFKNDGVNFAVGSYELTEKFKEELNIFLPKYIRAIYICENRDPNHNNIKEIRIEGHTSSEWSSSMGVAASANDAYINNMELSQSRTREIIKYALTMPELMEYHDFIKEKLTANGLSSSRLIKENGIEDKIKSRRIEFRVIADNDELLDTLKNI